METTYRVRIFGKSGCQKCKVLNRRLDKVMATEGWDDVEKEYCDVESENGLIAFCRAKCLNPSRIPALLVMRQTPDGVPEPVPNTDPGGEDGVCGASKLYQYLGLQTDYSDKGKGVISPKMIKAVVEQARAAAAATPSNSV